jgi:hypothetical protein
LLNLETINNWCKLAKNLVAFLVIFQLGGDQIGKVSEWLRGIKYLQLLAVFWEE